MNAADGQRRPALLYIADPMCSWCWGFAPVIAALRDTYAAQVPVRLIAGGLFPGTTEPMTSGFRSSVREHWQHVTEMTGQPFDFAFFEREQFVYDTEPPCRALVVARHLRPGSEFELLTRLHAAFYRDNRDITDSDVLVPVAVEAGLDGEAFRSGLESMEARKETLNDFALAQELGMRGLPTLLLFDGSEIRTISEGYRPREAVEARLRSLLDSVPAS